MGDEDDRQVRRRRQGQVRLADTGRIRDHRPTAAEEETEMRLLSFPSREREGIKGRACLRKQGWMALKQVLHQPLPLAGGEELRSATPPAPRALARCRAS